MDCIEETKLCTKCERELLLTKFPTRNTVKNGIIRRNICNACNNLKFPKKDTTNSERWNRVLQLKNDWRISNPVAVLCHNIKSKDKRNGWDSDITTDFVSDLIKNGCVYCGEVERIGLDRIDNSKGHTQDNVVACCPRCNYTRRDMPYAAWLRIAPAMRAAREAGEFGDWCGEPKSNLRKYSKIYNGNTVI